MSGRLGVPAFMDVGRDRQPGALTDRFERLQSFFKTGAAKRFAGSPIRLVEGRLEDERNLEPLRHGGQLIGDPEREIVRLDHAGPSDPDERFPFATGDVADMDGHGQSLRGFTFLTG